MTPDFFLRRPWAAGGAFPLGYTMDNLLGELQAIDLTGPGATVLAQSLARELLSMRGRVLIFVRDEEEKTSWLEKLAGDYLHPLEELSSDFQIKLAEWSIYVEALNRSVFDQYPAAATTGMWLAQTEKSAHDLLSLQLSFNDFNFDAAEYLELLNKIRLTQRLHQQMAYLPPAFQELNAGIFRHQNLVDSQAFIQEQVVSFTARAVALHSAFQSHLNAFYRRRRHWYQTTFNQLNASAQQLLTNRNLLVEAVGEEALSSVPGRLRAGFSKRMREHRQRILALYDDLAALIQAHEEISPFVFDWPAAPVDLPQTDWPDLLRNYRKALSEWFDNYHQYIREESLALNAKTIPTKTGGADELATLAKQLTDLIGAINESGLFQRPIQGAAATTTRQAKVLEQLLDKFRLLGRLLPDYPAFYRWQHNWFSLPAKLRRVISALLSLPDADWTTNFSAWYFERGLSAALDSTPSCPGMDTAKELADWLAGYRKTGRKQKPLKQRDHLVVLLPQDADPLGVFDLCIDFTASRSIKAPTMHIHWPPNKQIKAQYLRRADPLGTALPFFQPWYGSQLPTWQCVEYPRTKEEINALVKGWQEDFKVAKDDISSLAIPASYGGATLVDHYIQTTAEERPWLVGLKPNGMVEQKPMANYYDQEYVKALVFWPTNKSSSPDERLTAAWLRLLESVSFITLAHRLTANRITGDLLSDGLTANFLTAAFVRAAEAITANDHSGFYALAKEVRLRLGFRTPATHPLLRELLPRLKSKLPGYNLTIHQAWRDTFLPLVIVGPKGKRHVILPDGLLP
ncbi:MAG: hypothetical protein AAFU03_08010, partial [Bacteroidota bacterium]